MTVLAIISGVLFMLPLIAILVAVASGEKEIKTFLVKAVSVAVAAAVLMGIGVSGALAHNHIQNTADSAFSKTAHDLFVALKSEASTLVNQSNPVAGQISLKDPTTVVITPNNPAALTPGLSSAFYTIPLNSSDPTLKITGNLSADNKSWCFDLTSADPNMRADRRQVLYTELGQVAVSTGYCLGGLAYDTNDQLLK